MTETLVFDFDAVTPRMMLDFKEKTGLDVLSLAGDGVDVSEMPVEAIAGMVWLAMRMSGRPDATWDEALDTPLSTLAFDEDDDTADPTTAS